MSKTICVRSTVFKICQDELMTELMRALPMTDWCDLDRVLYNAHEAAKRHIEAHPKLNGRHSRYKVHLFFKHMAERLPDISPLLMNSLKMQGAPALESPDVGVEPFKRVSHTPRCYKVTRVGGSCNCGADTKNALAQARADFVPPPPEVLKRAAEVAGMIDGEPASGVIETVESVEPDAERMEVALKGKTPPTIPPDEESSPESFDEFAGMLNVPKFEDFEAVFAAWPYVMESQLDDDRVLVLGYLSGRDPRNDDALVRRNCAYTFRDVVDKPFKGLVSMVGYLKKTVRGNRLHIKVIPYHVGAKVRCWTNVQGEGDRAAYNRYLVLGEDGLVKIKTRGEYDDALLPPRVTV